MRVESNAVADTQLIPGDQPFHEESYQKHAGWYNRHFPTAEAKTEFYERMQFTGKGSIAHYLQQMFFTCLNPVLTVKDQHWLTVGDAYGFDAQYILSRGSSALATDLDTGFLAMACRRGIITQYGAANAEQLLFADDTFDYVLCKESYHHFPRPYAALYEMIRVARKGMVIMEPQDPVSKMPLHLLLVNLFANKSKLIRRLWKNRFSFEPVGNFVYKVSEREFEKFAAGLNLPMVAFKNINPNFHFKGAESMAADAGNKAFLRIKAKKRFLDLLVKLKIIPGQVLATMIFKQMPDSATIAALIAGGYRLVHIPPNPYR